MPITPEGGGSSRRWPVRAVLVLIRGYQVALSPLLGPRCRYLPSCSEYAAEAVELHGLIKGGRLAVARLLRCHPWGGSGLDPVPPREAP
ncbi:MAG: membrane protein insertion efficiency factor YidD [Gammaproteobacteria bacterium]|nr:membrane protein insertion efficiency factor YidD [Gammaproteobacteria bacterium]